MPILPTTSGDLEFTGEFFIPGRSGNRIEADHMERYKFACGFAGNRSVLDIACGLGYSAPMFIDAGSNEYTGVDLSNEQIRNAELRYGSDKGKFIVGDICRYDPGRTFDLIVSFETIEHVSTYKEALINLYSLLAKDGLLIVSSPNRPVTSPRSISISDRPENEYHTQEFTPSELIEQLREVGFLVDESKIYGQRQRFAGSSRILRRIRRFIGVNPDELSSPRVELVRSLTPRYFLLMATKA